MTWIEEIGRWAGFYYETGLYARPRRRVAVRRTARPVRQPAPSQAADVPMDAVGARPVNFTALLEVDVAESARTGRSGQEVFAARCRVVDRDDIRREQLLVPPDPYRGHLRLLFAPDPNRGPDGEECWVLIPVAPTVMTCHEAAAASFLIHPDFYSPAVET